MSFPKLFAEVVGYGFWLLILYAKCLLIYAAFLIIKGLFTGRTVPFDEAAWNRFHRSNFTDRGRNPTDYEIYMGDPRE